MGAPEKSSPENLPAPPPPNFSKNPSEKLGKFYSFGRRLLFALDAETAHHFTLSGLSAAAKTGLTNPLSPPDLPPLDTEVMGLRFPNAVGLAAGMDKDGTCIDGFGAIGFGFVEIGTLTPRPQPGNPRPRLFRIPSREAIINRMGFNNCGIHQGVANARRRTYKSVLGINIGKNFDTPNEDAVSDYLTCFREAYTEADYIAVNISSPNTKGLRDLLQEESCRALVGRLKEEQAKLETEHGHYTPLAVKIAPDADDAQIATLARLFRELGVDAVIATNTTISRDGVSGTKNADETGGLSGAPLTAKSTHVIRVLSTELGAGVPVIGAGGIMSGADALEKLEAGASLVQLYTGLVYHGPALVHDILQNITRVRNRVNPF